MHKHFERVAPFTAEGPVKVKGICDDLMPLVKGAPQDDGDKRRQFFDEPPHFGMDNHFSGGEVCKYIGENGGKATITSRRDGLPKSVHKKRFHFKK